MRADARRNLDRILCAARECFAESGFDIGVAEIARRADVGTATVFRRFETKDELVAAILAERLGDLQALACEAPDLRRFMEAAVELNVADRALIEGFMRSPALGDPEIRAAREALLTEVGRLLRDAQERGEVRPELVAMDVTVLVHAVARVGHVTEDTLPGLWRRYLAVVLDGLSGGRELPVAAPTLDELDAAVRASSG